MAHQSHSRRDFLQSTVALAASVMGSPTVSSQQTASPNLLDDADGQDVAVASIWRPERNFRVDVMSVSIAGDFPAAHGLQQEFDRGGLSGPAWTNRSKCDLPAQEARDAHRMALTFFEAEEPGIDLTLDCSQLEVPCEDGGLVVRSESHGFQIAGGTAVAMRWLTLGLTYQHWVTRALLGPLLTDFPRHVDREDIHSVLSAGWRSANSKTSISRISLSHIALAPLDESRPNVAIWRAWDEIQESAQAYLSGPPVGYILTVHAAQKPIATLHRESGALRALVNSDLPLVCGLDNLVSNGIPSFVSLVGVLDLDRCYSKS